MRSRVMTSSSGSPARMITTGTPCTTGRIRGQRVFAHEMRIVSRANTLTASTPDVTE